MILSPTASMRMPESTGSVERVETPFNTMDMAFCSSLLLMLNFIWAPVGLSVLKNGDKHVGRHYSASHRAALFSIWRINRFFKSEFT